MEKTGLSDAKLLKAIEDQLQHKFGGKGQRVVDDNMRVVRRGFSEVHEITNKVHGAGHAENTNGANCFADTNDDEKHPSKRIKPKRYSSVLGSNG